MSKGKTTLFLVLGICFGSQVMATSVKKLDPKFYGQFKMFVDPNKSVRYCDQGVSLSLDHTRYFGEVAILSDFVAGTCEIFAVPNERIYDLKVKKAGCGSMLYEGTRYDSDGVHTIRIIDHRKRICRDLPEGQIIMEEKGPQGTVRKLIAGFQRPQPAPITCMAYFTGFEFDARQGTCLSLSTSGCKNPFEFETREACISAHRAEISE